MTPLISAVIPTYNYGRFVSRAIESVLDQTWQNLECIVVDDGSTDDTQQVLQRFAGRIIIVRQENRGLAAARNAGIRAASGSFIALLDADDRWHPSKIDVQADMMRRQPHLGAVGCGRLHLSADGAVLEEIPGIQQQLPRESVLRGIALRRFWIGGSGSGAMIRRSVFDAVGLFDTDLTAAEDWDMWLRIAAAFEIDNVPEILTSIYRHGSGTFRNTRKMETNQWRVYEKAIAAWPDALTPSVRRQMRALILADAAGESIGAGEIGAALHYYRRSLSTWPLNARAWSTAARLTIRQIAARSHS
jgi:glycosyltransferase involved in cell wall biosynthesis